MARHSTLVCQVCRLQPHPEAFSPPLSIAAELIWREAGPLSLSFVVLPTDESSTTKAFIEHLVGLSSVPMTSGRRRDDLWQHTCFEAFLALPDQLAYWELNVSPSRDWNLYRFCGYRQGGEPEPAAVAPSVSLQPVGRGLRCAIELDPSGFWPASIVPDIALTMVVDHAPGCLSYWALHHPGKQADFHDRRGFLIL